MTVALSAAAKKRVFPIWSVDDASKAKRAPVETAPAFAEMAKRWSRYSAVWKAGLGNGDAEVSEGIRRAEPWLTKKGPPADADARALAAVLGMFTIVTLEYGADDLRQPLGRRVSPREDVSAD